jgi:TetR/AcrR family transcriptional repressor of nem operon
LGTFLEESSMTTQPRTQRGKISRQRILDKAVQLVSERGVRGTSLVDILSGVGASKSQFYHYFSSKDDLVQAVIGMTTKLVLDGQQPAISHLDSWENLDRWAELLVDLQRLGHFRGGCPIGSLASELADVSEPARLCLVQSFDEWEHWLVDGFTRMKDAGLLRQDASPGLLAVAVLASLQGGLLLTQTRKDALPLQMAFKSALTYARTFSR